MPTDGNKTSQTASYFTSKPATKDNKVLTENIRNMRGSHFAIGKQSISLFCRSSPFTLIARFSSQLGFRRYERGEYVPGSLQGQHASERGGSESDRRRCFAQRELDFRTMPRHLQYQQQKFLPLSLDRPNLARQECSGCQRA